MVVENLVNFSDKTLNNTTCLTAPVQGGSLLRLQNDKHRIKSHAVPQKFKGKSPVAAGFLRSKVASQWINKALWGYRFMVLLTISLRC